jgi:N-acetylglucosamine kinase-like BadF-type ATPase
MRVTVVGVDLGKTRIEVCGQSASGKVVMTGKYKPAQFRALMAQVE